MRLLTMLLALSTPAAALAAPVVPLPRPGLPIAQPEPARPATCTSTTCLRDA